MQESCACGFFPIMGTYQKNESKDPGRDFVHSVDRCYPYTTSRVREEGTEIPAATPTYREEGRLKIGWKRR